MNKALCHVYLFFSTINSHLWHKATIFRLLVATMQAIPYLTFPVPVFNKQPFTILFMLQVQSTNNNLL